MALVSIQVMVCVSSPVHAALTTEVDSATILAGTFDTAQPNCPEGAIAVSGGTDVENVLNMEVTASAPVFGTTRLLFQPDGSAPAPTGWFGAAVNNQAFSATMKAGAICSSDISASAEVNSMSVPSGSYAGSFVMCPMGTVAIGGGIDVNNVLTMKVTASALLFPGPVVPIELFGMPDGAAPAPVGWAGFVRNDDASPLPMKVAVICSSAVSPSVLIQSSPVSNGSFGGSNVQCPAGTNATGGGIDLTNVLTMTVTSTSPLFSGMNIFLADQPDGAGPAPSGWDAYARNDSGGDALVKVAAICVPEPSATLVECSVWVTLALLTAARRSRPSSLGSR